MGLAVWDRPLKFADVTCVDQSVFHLEIAKKEWQIQRENAKDPETPKGELNLKVFGPDLLAAVAGKRFDFVYSMIVLQLTTYDFAAASCLLGTTV